MAGTVLEYVSPSLAGMRDGATVSVFSKECLSPELQVLGSTLGSATWTANLITYIPLVIAEALKVSQFFWTNGTAVAGNTDVGIYSADGTVKLGSTGSTANAGTSVLQVVDVTDFWLPPNSLLWLALGCDSGTQTFRRSNLIIHLQEFIGIKQQAAGWSSGLPSSATFANPSVASLPMFGFTAGTVL